MIEDRYLFNYLYVDQDRNAGFKTEFIWSNGITEKIVDEWIARSKKDIEEELKREVNIAVLSIIKLGSDKE